ncbi:hypothetical protein [Paenibacillus alkalitolerans]|uniref:hypothetical protein n=1 Tax=Paenibacillus alkalitolerans TaxID=2799335 RepID=UPI0018F6DFDA|nr:hypothetical protein [Paenibacillus alkalitolerans]
MNHVVPEWNKRRSARHACSRVKHGGSRMNHSVGMEQEAQCAARLFQSETRWFKDEPRCAGMEQEAECAARLFQSETRWFTDEPRCAGTEQARLGLLKQLGMLNSDTRQREVLTILSSRKQLKG